MKVLSWRNGWESGEVINNKQCGSTIQGGILKRVEIEKRVRSAYEQLSKHDS